jgi:hypothetical protein
MREHGVTLGRIEIPQSLDLRMGQAEPRHLQVFRSNQMAQLLDVP